MRWMESYMTLKSQMLDERIASPMMNMIMIIHGRRDDEYGLRELLGKSIDDMLAILFLTWSHNKEHYITIYPRSVSLLIWIERASRKFIWSGDVNNRKMVMVAWKISCALYANGQLWRSNPCVLWKCSAPLIFSCWIRTCH